MGKCTYICAHYICASASDYNTNMHCIVIHTSAMRTMYNKDGLPSYS